MKHWRALLFLLALLALAPGARAAEDGVRAVIVYEGLCRPWVPC